MYHLHVLEQAAINDGWGFNQRLMAFRKIYYDGMAWDIIIPAGENVADRPPSWQNNPNAQASLAWMRQNQNKEIQINGVPVDIHHVFAGLDARQNPSNVDAVFANLSRNVEAATYVGDLGSVVGEYFVEAGDDISFAQFANHYNQSIGRRAWTNFGEADINSDVDAYAINLNTSLTLHQNLYNYYNVASQGQGYTKRFTNFARRTGLIDGANKLIQARVDELRNSVFIACQMYLAGEGYRNYRNDNAEGPHAMWFQHSFDTTPGNSWIPSFRYAFNNVVRWVVDLFVEDIMNRIKNE